MTAAIVLGGGRARRLDGADKAAVEVDGLALIDHVYAAVSSCAPVIAVGGPTLARDGVRVVREHPPFGGPAAATLAGLAALAGADADETWLLACDLPRASTLVAALSSVPIPPGVDGVVATDEDDRMQWLAGRYRIVALRRAADALPAAAGASMGALLRGLRLHAVDVGGAAVDLDTWTAIEEYRNRDPKETP